jgi:serine/threonine protein kinase
MEPVHEDSFEDYVLGKTLGIGAMGTVYRARRKADDLTVAVKIIRETKSLPRFWREARALQSVHHPNVVRYMTHGKNYLVTDLCEGVTMSRYWAEGGRWTTSVALDIGIGICDGLAAIHAAGLIHRDMKPGNVFLVARGLTFTPIILDFGMVKPIVDEEPFTDPWINPVTLVTERRVLGTPGYVSPEQAQGRPLGPSTDIYSLGCLIFLLLTGEELIHEEGNEAVNLIASGTPEARLEKLVADEKVVAFVRRLLDNDPAKRPSALEAAQIMRELREELGRPVRMPPASSTRPNNWVIGTVAAFVGGLLTLLIAPAVLRSRLPPPSERANASAQSIPTRNTRPPLPVVPRPLPAPTVAEAPPRSESPAPRVVCPRRPTFAEGLRVGHKNRVPDRTYWWQCQTEQRRARLCTRFHRYGHGQDSLVQELCPVHAP